MMWVETYNCFQNILLHYLKYFMLYSRTQAENKTRIRKKLKFQRLECRGLASTRVKPREQYIFLRSALRLLRALCRPYNYVDSYGARTSYAISSHSRT